MGRFFATLFSSSARGRCARRAAPVKWDGKCKAKNFFFSRYDCKSPTKSAEKTSNHPVRARGLRDKTTENHKNKPQDCAVCSSGQLRI